MAAQLITNEFEYDGVSGDTHIFLVKTRRYLVPVTFPLDV